jgi:radical SAM superfamily enzyme YgiQ (UPF0313 family)
MAWVALVGPELEENLSLRYLASSLERAGVRAEIVPFSVDEDFADALAAIVGAGEPPLAVGLSLAFQWRARDFLALAIALRQAGYGGHITAGGHFATFAGADLLRDFGELDSICRQEAEETLVALVSALAAGRPWQGLAGLYVRDGAGEVVATDMPPLPDLAQLPRPDRRGEPARCFGHGIAPLVGSRGCYANCTFCCIAAWHEQSLPGKRYRLREVDDVADEMVSLKRERGVEVFVFHDDNFFVPGHKKNVQRLSALADALEARGIGRFATVVKARPTDVDPAVFRVLRDRLGCIRVYVGIETDADQGLKTLRRWAPAKQNRSALAVVESLGLYACFNLLLFDPDTTIESVETNVAFMRHAADYPFNFGRVELYAGTPLLARMQAEGRCVGDYMQYDYALGSPAVERAFTLALACFEARNFGDDALANRLMGTRFDVEVCRHFHSEVFRASWLERGKALSRALSLDTADGLEAIVARVKGGASEAGDEQFTAELAARLRATERAVEAGARELAYELQAAVGQGSPLTELGDRVATPLQRAVGL